MYVLDKICRRISDSLVSVAGISPAEFFVFEQNLEKSVTQKRQNLTCGSVFASFQTHKIDSVHLAETQKVKTYCDKHEQKYLKTEYKQQNAANSLVV